VNVIPITILLVILEMRAGNDSRFINHRCVGYNLVAKKKRQFLYYSSLYNNLINIVVMSINSGSDGFERVAFFAVRKIEKGEMLSYNYG